MLKLLAGQFRFERKASAADVAVTWREACTNFYVLVIGVSRRHRPWLKTLVRFNKHYRPPLYRLQGRYGNREWHGRALDDDPTGDKHARPPALL